MVELTYLSLKKTTFFVRIFDISACVFTQISIGRARWMHNLIPHPTSTHTAYFWRTPLPQKQKIPEKMWWWQPRYPKNKKYLKKCDDDHHNFSGISCFWVSGSVKSIQCGYLLDTESNYASNELSRSKFE